MQEDGYVSPESDEGSISEDDQKDGESAEMVMAAGQRSASSSSSCTRSINGASSRRRRYVPEVSYT